ncbi:MULTISPECIES: DUF4347 domain-containing protein [Methylomicrobium]|uniref:DUF4347 domain-containing protein n=1 Tax=Methylomicrobium album BG8 TaxID=686340 RepID=H8GNA0_METAL|nr:MULTISPECIES: DUF4347 domain-containing protein [Methylomicrobium]EIC28329.1 hypothetical protein Metal_0478 [Methylomicrobium album BG8]
MAIFSFSNAQSINTATTPAGDVYEDSAAPATLLVIDARVPDYQSLLADLPANVAVRIVQADESGLNAIGMELANLGGVSSTPSTSSATAAPAA